MSYVPFDPEAFADRVQAQMAARTVSERRYEEARERGGYRPPSIDA